MSTLNQTLFQFVHPVMGRNIFFDDTAVFFAQYLPYLMVAAFLILALKEQGWRKSFYVFAEGAIAIMVSRGLVTEIIRQFYHHERPFSFYRFTPLIAEQGWSFPSGHMMWFFALSITVWYVNRKWGWWFLGLSAVMGVARVWVGVHWPADIAAGIVLGIACGMLVHWLLRKSREALYRQAGEGSPVAPPPASSAPSSVI